MHPTMITAILRFTQMILVTIYLGDMGGGVATDLVTPSFN